MLRGQGYDGAAVMSGARTDLAVQIPPIRDVMDLTRELVNFFKCSPKRTKLFKEIKGMACSAEASNMGLHPLCPTRWTVRTASLQLVCSNYSTILQALADITDNSKDDACPKAVALLRRMESFDLFFQLTWHSLCLSQLKTAQR